MRLAVLMCFATAATVAGCATEFETEQPNADGPVAYDTHGPVTLHIDGTEAELADQHLSIHVPGEGTLFEGNAAYAAEFSVVLKVSPGVTQLRATLRDPSGAETETWVPIEEREATLAVGAENE